MACRSPRARCRVPGRIPPRPTRSRGLADRSRSPSHAAGSSCTAAPRSRRGLRPRLEPSAHRLEPFAEHCWSADRSRPAEASEYSMDGNQIVICLASGGCGSMAKRQLSTLLGSTPRSPGRCSTMLTTSSDTPLACPRSVLTTETRWCCFATSRRWIAGGLGY